MLISRFARFILVFVVAAALSVFAAEQPGLRADYFADPTLTERVASRIETSIDHAWGSGSPDARVPSDRFSARWTGTLTASGTGAYRLYATSDDGVRVWVGGVLVIDRWVNQAARTSTATVALTKDTPTAVRVEYFENLGQAAIQLEWDGPGLTRQVIPTSALRGEPPVALLPPGSGKGLRGNYFTGIDFVTQAFGRIDPVIDFNWLRGSPVTGLMPDRFSVRWTGQVLPRASETYTFYVRSDDGVRLWVGNQLLIDQWQVQGAKTWTGCAGKSRRETRGASPPHRKE